MSRRRDIAVERLMSGSGLHHDDPPQNSFTLTSRLRHSSLHRLPRSVLVSPSATDQKRFLPKPATRSNGGNIESEFGGGCRHMSISACKLI